ncbi:MAG: CHAT domain-containing protein [Planctomycetia bacterium]|nr:CHAT domain-containing protein [Planctomycetia bacterium]
MATSTIIRCLGACLVWFASVGALRAADDPATNVDHGQIFYRQGDYARAAPLLQSALEAIDQGQLSEEQYLARCLTPLVDIYVTSSRFEEALPLAERQLRWFEKLPDDGDTLRQRREFRGRIGDIHAGLGNLEEARKAWRAALEMPEGNARDSGVWRLETQWKLADPATNPLAPRTTQEQLAQDATAIRQQLASAAPPPLDLLVRATKVEASCLAALDQQREALAANRSLLQQFPARPAHPAAFAILIQTASWERELSEFDAAAARLRAELRNLEADDQSLRRAIALKELGLTLKLAGQPHDAANAWKMLIAAEQLYHKLGKPRSDLERYASLDRIRLAYEELGDFADALRAAEAAYELAKSSPAWRRHATDVLGALCTANGQYERAVELLSESLELAKQDPHAPPEALPTTLTNLGNAYRKLGRYDDAEQAFIEVLARCKSLYQPGDLPLAEAQSNVAAIASERGRHAEAIALLREALAGAERAGPSGKPLRAALLQFLAMNYLSQGQKDRAAEHLQAAIDVDPAAPLQSIDAARRAVERYLALALVQLSRNQLPEAERAARAGLDLATLHQLKNDGVYASAERLLGRIALANGRKSAAEKFWLAALHSQEQRRAATEAARTLADLGNLAVREKQFDAAEKYYRRALAQQSDVHDLPILHYNILGNLGQLIYYSKGDHAAGLQLLKQAADLLETPRAATIGGGERQRAEFFARDATVFDLLVDNNLAAGDVATAFRYAERARNRTFLDQLQLAGVDLRDTLPADARAALLQRERELADRLAKSRTELSANHGQPSQAARDKQLGAQVRALQQDFAQVWGEIRDASPFYREILSRRMSIGSLEAVQREAIPPDALMLFYALGDFQSHLLVIGHEPGDVKAFDLVLPEALAADLKLESRALTRATAVRLVDEYLAALRDVEGGRGLAGIVQSPRGLMAPDRGRLVTEVFLPADVRKYIGQRGPDHAIVVPDGALHQLPLECLVITPGNQPVFALDTLPPLTYAPSATILLSLLQRTANAKGGDAAELLSVGNPSYQNGKSTHEIAATRDAFVDFGGQLDELPGTLIECRRAVEAFGADRSLLFVGEQASESAVREHIAGRRYVHLAAHGLVDEQADNLFGAIALTPPATPSVDEDGFLALHEIYALNLNGCELTALSACRTNVGGDRPLEAGSTLARAFLAAGARRVVCSQWNVDDAAGSELVATLWEEIAAMEKSGQRIHYAKALRSAQRRIRQQPELASAYYWSPFVLIGPAVGD